MSAFAATPGQHRGIDASNSSPDHPYAKQPDPHALSKYWGLSTTVAANSFEFLPKLAQYLGRFSRDDGP